METTTTTIATPEMATATAVPATAAPAEEKPKKTTTRKAPAKKTTAKITKVVAAPTPDGGEINITADTKEAVPLETLAREINGYSQAVAQNILEIGKRLIQAKAQVPHGQWDNWLKENVNYTRYTAYKFMQCAERFSNVATSQHLELNASQLFELLALPEDEVQPFISEQQLERTPVKDMGIRELRAAIKLWRDRAELAKSRALDFKNQCKDWREQFMGADLNTPSDVIIQTPPDYQQVIKENEELKQANAQLEQQAAEQKDVEKLLAKIAKTQADLIKTIKKLPQSQIVAVVHDIAAAYVKWNNELG